MMQKRNQSKGQQKRKSIPANRHGKASHRGKGKKVVKPSKVTKEVDADKGLFQQSLTLNHQPQPQAKGSDEGSTVGSHQLETSAWRGIFGGHSYYGSNNEPLVSSMVVQLEDVRRHVASIDADMRERYEIVREEQRRLMSTQDRLMTYLEKMMTVQQQSLSIMTQQLNIKHLPSPPPLPPSKQALPPPPPPSPCEQQPAPGEDA